MPIASRTPEGSPNHCPLCGARFRLEPSQPPGDAPCPQCGCLVWFPEQLKLGAPVAVVNFASLVTAAGKSLSPEHIHAGMRRWRPLLESCTALVLRFEEGVYLPSACIGELVWLHTSARRLGRHLLIIAPRGSRLREILQLTKLDTVLALFEDQDAALASLE
jgi:hypothetical protein